MIISASRRTDIPSSHTNWFLNRLKDNYVITQNPILKNKFYKIPLNKNIVDIIIFWSKNPDIDFLKYVYNLGYNFYLNFTINPYNAKIEKNIPDKNIIIEKFKNISKLFGKEKIIWRYDPIIFNDNFNYDYHIKNFENISNNLNGYTDECIFSFIKIYSKIKNNINKLNDDKEEKQLLINDIKAIANKNNIKLKSCSQSFYGVENSSCIDKDRIEKIIGYSIKEKRDKYQRKLCKCLESIDIGSYNTCNNGCIYCYANSKNILKNYDINNEILSDIKLNKDNNISDRKIIINKI